jgi:hypothetical protein
MDTLSRSDLETLLAGEGEPHVSIFMPAHSVVDPQQDPIRLRKLLEQAEEKLVEGGLRLLIVREMMDPAWNLLERGLFPQPGYHSEGLALFIARNFFRHYHVPIPLDEQVVLGDKFTIEPLLPLIDDTEQGSFFVLALSLNAVRLLRATHRTVREIELPRKVPASLAEAMRYDDFEKEHQFYSGTPGWRGGAPGAGGSVGRTGAVFYGQGTESDVKKDNILRFFQQVDSGLHSLLRNERIPMVLAGVDYLQPIYRQANTYGNLAARGIAGNPDEKRAEELRDEAWQVVLPLLQKARRDATDRYMRLAGTGQTFTDISKIVPAAFQGQVDTLFIVRTAGRGGASAEPVAESGGVEREPVMPVDKELLNLAAVHTLLNHGTIYVTDQALAPDGAAVAAILRY